MKRLIGHVVVCLAVIMSVACGKEDCGASGEKAKTYALKYKKISGVTPLWNIGECVYFADDYSVNPGTKVQVTQSLISQNGAKVQATFRSASEKAQNVFVICADDAWIRKWVSSFSLLYDGTLASSLVAVGESNIDAKEIELSSLMGVVEFRLKSSKVHSVVIKAASGVFPKDVTYDFKGKEMGIKTTLSTIKVSTDGAGIYYFPILPDIQATGVVVDLCGESGSALASFTYDDTIEVAAGAMVSMGIIDADLNEDPAIDPSTPQSEYITDAIKNMGVGLSLGGMEVFPGEGKVTDRNDPYSFECMYGGEITTFTTSATAKAGFKCVRLPVTWILHMDNPTSKIDDVWLDRIEDIVTLVLNEGMYCILNVHHDSGQQAEKGAWLFADWANYSEISAGLINVWTQIAERFKDYDYRLLFEGFNEILDENKAWFRPTTENGYKAANALNQDFVDCVRATGGKNVTRNLIVTTYSASTWEEALRGFVMPQDLLSGHLAVQVHSYLPQPFVTAYENYRVEFYESDIKEIHDMFDLLKTHLLDKGYPCILGEYGAYDRKNDEARGRHAAVYARKALELGIAPIYWYSPMSTNDRKLGVWTVPALKDSLIKAYTEHIEKLR